MAHFLEVKDLRIGFEIKDQVATAVDGVSFYVDRGETLCIVGESGSGKSVTSMSMIQLLPVPPARYLGGSIRFEGQELLTMTEKQINQYRGEKIAMIFQEPMTALNPVLTIGTQLIETIRAHSHVSRREAYTRALELLERVGINDREKRMRQYPHELSGGMKQRIVIAMALSGHPELLIADEPTTALDVTIQAQILELLKQIKRDFKTTIIFITHDLGVVASMADRVAVMYAGQIVETAGVKELYRQPRHPYTKGLLQCIPHLTTTEERLTTIPGVVPGLTHMPAGCRFCTRCPYATERCKTEVPPTKTEGTHSYACFL